MISVKNGNIDLNILEVTDIIDISMLQKFLDNFALGMNCAAVSVDRNGHEITRPSYYRPFCEDFIHKSSLGDERCAKCHNQMGQNAVKQGKPFVGPCHAGLIDFAAPIIIKGVHLGTVLGGQILERAPEEYSIKQTASELGFSGDDLWKAAQNIDIVQRRNIEAAAEVLYIVINTMAQDGFKNLEINMVSKELADTFIQISHTVEELAKSAQDITINQHNLTSKIGEVGHVTNQVSQVLDNISKIAYKTKLLGLNSSIEAARLGQAASGFNVVSRQIQELAANSQATAAEISELTQQINMTIDATIREADSTMQITEDQSASMEELSATSQNAVNLAQRLQNLID